MIKIYTSTAPWQQLRRMTPLRLQTVVQHGETVERLLKALSLLARFFPEEYGAYSNISIWQTRTQWMDIVVKFFPGEPLTFIIQNFPGPRALGIGAEGQNCIISPAKDPVGKLR